MKVIYFVGYGDYDAIEFEKEGIDLGKLFDSIKNGKSYIDGNGFEADLYAYEFGEVDENFVKFIRSEIQSSKKQINFYIVEE